LRLTIFKRYFSKLFRRVIMVSVRKIYFFVNFAEKTFAVDRLWTFCERKFCGFWQKNAKTAKLSSAKLSSLEVAEEENGKEKNR